MDEPAVSACFQGRTHARDGWFHSHPRGAQPFARGSSAPDRRFDRQRHQGRSRTLYRSRYGRLHQQTDQTRRTPTSHSAASCGARCNVVASVFVALEPAEESGLNKFSQSLNLAYPRWISCEVFSFQGILLQIKKEPRVSDRVLENQFPCRRSYSRPNTITLIRQCDD